MMCLYLFCIEHRLPPFVILIPAPTRGTHTRPPRPLLPRLSEAPGTARPLRERGEEGSSEGGPPHVHIPARRDQRRRAAYLPPPPSNPETVPFSVPAQSPTRTAARCLSGKPPPADTLAAGTYVRSLLQRPRTASQRRGVICACCGPGKRILILRGVMDAPSRSSLADASRHAINPRGSGPRARPLWLAARSPHCIKSLPVPARHSLGGIQTPTPRPSSTPLPPFPWGLGQLSARPRPAVGSPPELPRTHGFPSTLSMTPP